jgi:hypothetical protein
MPLKQFFLRAEASDGLICQFFFAAAGDELKAAAF